MEAYGEDQLTQKLTTEFTAGSSDIDAFLQRPLQEARQYVLTKWYTDLNALVKDPSKTPADWNFADFQHAPSATLDRPPRTASAGARRPPIARGRGPSRPRHAGAAAVPAAVSLDAAQLLQVGARDHQAAAVRAPTLENYLNVFATQNFGQYMWNSTVIAAGSTALGLLRGLPAAYSIARYKQQALSLAILLARIVPGITFLIPLFILFRALGLVDTVKG